MTRIRVEDLTLYLDSYMNATKLISEFTKLFQNVKNFTYKVRNDFNHGLNHNHNWKSLESIDCDLEDIDIFFKHVNLCI